MKKFSLLLLLLTLILSSCSTPQTDPTVTTDPNAPAFLEGFNGSIWVQSETDTDPVQLFEANGPLFADQEILTLFESDAQVNLKDGTIIRLGEMTNVEFLEFSGEEIPFDTRLTLLGGQLWVILAGGSLQVETAFGTASVTGSYLGVEFDLENQILTATCLEGTCNLENENGSTGLISGQASSIKGVDQFPSAAETMSEEQINEWVQENPEAATLTGRSVPTEEAVIVEVGATNETTDLPWIPYYFENNCVSGPYANTEWRWVFQKNLQTDPRPVIASWLILIPSGQVRSGLIPSGDGYTVHEALRLSNTVIYTRSQYGLSTKDMKPYEIVLCPDQPRLPSTAPGMPTAVPGVIEELPPLTYWMGNNCLDDVPFGARSHTNWHWTFKMVPPPGTNDAVQDINVEVIVPPGESRSGELPPGYYLIKDWTEEGSVNTPEYVGRSGELYLNLCPNNQRLPGDPYPSGEPTDSPSIPEPTTHPVNYTLNNTCKPSIVSGNWHFLFIGPITLQVDLADGETRNGTLPSGTYEVYTWYDSIIPINVQAAETTVIDPAINSSFTFDSCSWTPK